MNSCSPDRIVAVYGRAWAKNLHFVNNMAAVGEILKNIIISMCYIQHMNKPPTPASQLGLATRGVFAPPARPGSSHIGVSVLGRPSQGSACCCFTSLFPLRARGCG